MTLWVSGFVITTITAPGDPAGTVTTISVGDCDVTVAAVPPNVTEVTGLMNPVPAIVTLLPPAWAPLFGEIDPIVGSGL